MTGKRWTPRAKREVLWSVAEGELTMAEACESHEMSEEEFLEWQNAYRKHGLKGLRQGVFLQRRRRMTRMGR